MTIGGFSTIQAKESSAHLAKQTKINVSAVVDEYLAIYKNTNGNVKAETNATNDFYANESVCVINY